MKKEKEEVRGEICDSAKHIGSLYSKTSLQGV